MGVQYTPDFAGYETILPYSGREWFSYPLFFGLLSNLFSFGKGIVFFAPGLLLPLTIRTEGIKKELLESYKLWICFLAGLLLLYSKWWAWYGGWYWGPRFFLFASIPASFAVAITMSDKESSLGRNLFILAILALSFWVGINGAVFYQNNLEIGTANNYALEFLVWYVPEFSVLWRPFVVANPLTSRQITMIVYGVVVFSYLSMPLVWRVWAQLKANLVAFVKRNFYWNEWRF